MSKLIPYKNDLYSQFPFIAKEANGWDPSEVAIGSNTKQSWKCKYGHIWEASTHKRTNRGDGCPYCANKQVWPGFNDLKTKFPEIAKEANGWDPSEVLTGSDKKKKSWKCKLGHIWETTPYKRCHKKYQCPYCSNKKVLPGFNDLKTKFPEIAKEADGWDPSKELFGSSKKLSWKCEFGHTWKTKIIARTGFNKTSCPTCSVSGFDPNKIAWLYLMGKKDEQQIGITNVIKKRVQKHKREGWKEIDQIGPYNGQKISEIEKELKLWIKKNIGLVPNKLENWYTKDLKISSLKDLKKISNLKTNLF